MLWVGVYLFVKCVDSLVFCLDILFCYLALFCFCFRFVFVWYTVFVQYLHNICFVFVWNSVLYFIMFRLDFLRYGVRNRELAQGANILDRWIYSVGCWFDLFVCSLFCLYVFICCLYAFWIRAQLLVCIFGVTKQRNRE